MKARIGPSGKLLCLRNVTTKTIISQWTVSKFVWLLGRYEPSSPCTKELRGQAVYLSNCLKGTHHRSGLPQVFNSVAKYCFFLKVFYEARNKVFFKNMGHPRPLFRLFSSFQTNITILTTNICGKCYVHPVYGAGIRTHNLQSMSLLP